MSNNLTFKRHKICQQRNDFDFKGQARALTQVEIFTLQGQGHTSQNHTIPQQQWKKIHIFQSNSQIDYEAAFILLL